MDFFLKRVAADLQARCHGQYANCWVVLPSRRACLYLKQFLAEQSAIPQFSPVVLSMEDFTERLSRVEIADRVTLLLELYRTFRIYDPAPGHTLERFVPLGTAILKDFNLIDFHLSPPVATELFRNLSDAKNIDRWAMELAEDYEPSASARAYFDFWKNLELVYEEFREVLLEQNLAYPGMAARLLAEQTAEALSAHTIGRIAFAGFNHLTAAERQIILNCAENIETHTYWDSDTFYLDTVKVHEAGHYGRKNRSVFAKTAVIFEEELIGTRPLSIRMVRVPDEAVQAKMAGAYLQQHLHSGVPLLPINDTALLLPDENALLPLLYALPETSHAGEKVAELVNITMGFPLSLSPLSDLLSAMFKYQRNLQRYEPGREYVYYKDLVRFVGHPYLKDLEDFTSLQQEIFREKKVYIRLAELQERFRDIEIVQGLLSPWQDDYRQVCAQFRRLCEMLSEGMVSEGMDSHVVFQFYTLVARLEDQLARAVGQGEEPPSVAVFQSLLTELLRGSSVPFAGEPIAPVQIMGMLESRALDFRHVVVLSCTEGTLPKGKQADSLIPFELRQQYQLPTHIENDASYAYTFYRLFHRAETVTLLYPARTATTDVAEPSRFLTQLKAEFRRFAPIVSIEETDIVLPLPVSGQREVLEKDETILAQLRQKLQNGVSPSALALFMKNPLAFYRNYVLKLEEFDFEEDIGAREFGNILHKTLENLLFLVPSPSPDVPFGEANRPVPLPTTLANGLLDDLLGNDGQRIRTELEWAARQTIGTSFLHKGENFLQLHTAFQLISRFLRQQKEEEVPQGVELILAEQYLWAEFQVALPNAEPVKVKITGMADRMDAKGGMLRVVDYKTGKFDKKDIQATSWEDLLLWPLTEKSKEKIIQLLCYKYLTIRSLDESRLKDVPANLTTAIQSGFYFFRNLSEGFVSYQLEDEPDALANPQDFLGYTEHVIGHIVAAMLDPELPLSEEPVDFSNRV